MIPEGHDAAGNLEISKVSKQRYDRSLQASHHHYMKNWTGSARVSKKRPMREMDVPRMAQTKIQWVADGPKGEVLRSANEDTRKGKDVRREAGTKGGAQSVFNATRTLHKSTKSRSVSG